MLAATVKKEQRGDERVENLDAVQQNRTIVVFITLFHLSKNVGMWWKETMDGENHTCLLKIPGIAHIPKQNNLKGRKNKSKARRGRW